MEKDLDKVYEVYMNDTETDLTRKTRERIQWICNQTSGENILDVGCSQGITSILLARENKKVLALDIEDEAIEFAKQKLLLEAEDIQKNVEFSVGDFVTYDFQNKKFNTVIMTEVLEHIEDVHTFIQKIEECIDDDSKIVITVPFGISDHRDHKRTYYFANLYEQLESTYDIINVEFMGKWLGVVAQLKSKQNKENIIVPDKKLLLAEEDAFFAIERTLVDKNNKYKQYIAEQKEKISNFVKREQCFQERNEKLVQREKELKEKVERLVQREKELKAKLEERSQKVRSLFEIINSKK